MNGFESVKPGCSGGSGECVEVVRSIPRTVAVRDSEDSGGGPALRPGPRARAAFMRSSDQ
ncbi:DUF397 domain-containing protein [Streptomyces sp. NPDC093586]|uniref:DUF397 domain-containing protein n=1 Tax=Streptomyces sp. NPDC093586 TaxID=3366042 RepID=UPI00381F803E